MTLDLLRERLGNQQLTQTGFRKPGDVVARLGAAGPGLYGREVGHRAAREWSHRCGVEPAFNEGHILQSHMMRPTWHFATPVDILVDAESDGAARRRGSFSVRPSFR
jgi:hypothetical protein